jgi:hypothetical protein
MSRLIRLRYNFLWNDIDFIRHLFPDLLNAINEQPEEPLPNNNNGQDVPRNPIPDQSVYFDEDEDDVER